MKTAQLDIVIPVKAGSQNEELRYCLRSIAANFPHRRIFLVGHLPEWARGVEHIPEPPSDKRSRFSRLNDAINNACLDPRISRSFVRFDDDFFVMKPAADLQPMRRVRLDVHIAHFDKLDASYRSYADGLIRTRQMLERLGVRGDHSLYSYELHMPMIFRPDRLRLLCRLERDINPYGLLVHYRTLYGNYFQVGGDWAPDVKIFTNGFDPRIKDSVYLSTTNLSFEHGEVGNYIRQQFQNPCKYEVAP